MRQPSNFFKIGIIAVALLVGAFVFSQAKPWQAEGAPNPLPPLLSCANVDASDDNGVRVSDILQIVQAYFHDYPGNNYVFMDDLVNPYNPETGTGGQQRIDDILSVVGQYFHTCPVVDTQIAIATRAMGDPTFSSVLCDPNLAVAVNCGGDGRFLIENVSFLASKNYYPDGPDVPGQGIRYSKAGNGTGFNPARPDALIYKNGRLAAQSYFVDGSVPGWGDSPTLGTTGYLWNWLPNANLVPDSPASNGRFADCFPDMGGWGPYSCPEVLPDSLQLASGVTSLDALKQLIEGDSGLAPVLRAVAAGAAGQGAGAGITVGQIFGNFRVVCVYPNGGLSVAPVEDVNAPNC